MKGLEGARDEFSFSADERAEMFYLECRKQAGEPPRDAEHLVPCAEGLHRASLLQPVQETLREIFQERHPFVTPEYIYLLWAAALRKAALKDPERFGYPHVQDYTAPKTWFHLNSRVMFDDQLREEFLYDMTKRELATSVGDRAKILIPIESTIRSLGRIGTRKLRIIEIGCSMQTGIKQAVLGTPRFKPVVAGEEYVGTPRDRQITCDDALTRGVNALISQRLGIERYVGIDIADIYDEEAQLYEMACRFSPGYQKDEKLVAEHRELVRARVPNIEFRQHDIRNGLPEDLTNEGYDLAWFSTMLYELPPAERVEAIETVAPHVQFIGSLEFGRVDIDDPTKIRIAERIHGERFSYTAMVRDTRDRSRHFQEVARFNDGRCDEMLLGRLAVKGEFTEAFHEQVLKAAKA